MIADIPILDVAIASKSARTADALTPLLRQCRLRPTCQVDSDVKIRKLVADHPPDLVVINTPLADDFGTRLAMDLAERNIPVLILVKNELYEQVSYKLEPYGIITLGKPASGPLLIQSVKILRAMQQKIARLESQKQTLEAKMDEIKLVNRAKWILIGRLNMTEVEANRYIEKTAMDSCRKKGAVAKDIIKMYEV